MSTTIDNTAETLVEHGAYLVHAGHMDVDALVVPDREEYDDLALTDAELREAVQERLEDLADDGEEDEDDADPTAPADVDWPALWSEFGFESPNANGDVIAHHPQLVAAVESSDQEIARDADAVIDEGVRQGEIVPDATTDTDGERHVRGYVLEVSA